MLEVSPEDSKEEVIQKCRAAYYVGIAMGSGEKENASDKEVIRYMLNAGRTSKELQDFREWDDEDEALYDRLLEVYNELNGSE
jgi:sugar/nucleoside kinase (ribokinase family)